MKLALVHDYLREYGGAERVVEVFHEIWPEAPLYTSFVDWPSFAKAPAGKIELFKSMDIRTSWVQHNPIVKRWHSPLRFLAPKIWSSFDLSDYDVVLSSSGWFMCRGVALNNSNNKNLSHLESKAKLSEKLSFLSSSISSSNGQKLKNEHTSQDTLTRATQTPRITTPLHICYIHHPPRNLYGYPTGSDLQKYAIVRAYAALINFYLRHYDFETAQKVDYFIANSKETARRVEKFYRRESTVIYPPINNPIIKLSNNQIIQSKYKNYYLSVGRLSWSKRVDLAILACNKMKLPLKVVGVGKEEKSLKEIAGPTIEFVGAVSDAELANLYTGAKALIFSALDEDFGMVPVEAMAYGTPVIGLAQGGVKETVIEGKTGMLFQKPEVEDVISVITKFAKTDKEWKNECVRQAQKFSKENFKKQIRAYVNICLNNNYVGQTRNSRQSNHNI
jgi:glycosyltransferase involved in cell wall biosynthesis